MQTNKIIFVSLLLSLLIGCKKEVNYDGLEENNVNLNQGAESTVSYLMARLCFDKLPGTSTELIK